MVKLLDFLQVDIHYEKNISTKRTKTQTQSWF